jgi:hypothetical protein
MANFQYRGKYDCTKVEHRELSDAWDAAKVACNNAGHKVSSASFIDYDNLTWYVCSIADCGPRTYGHPRWEAGPGYVYA